MKKLDLGQYITILANVGVVAGIVILILELRQNTVATELLAAESVLSSITEQNRLIVENRQIAELLAALPDVRRSADDLQLRNLFAARLRRWEHAHYQLSRGQLDEGVWAAFESNNVGLLSNISTYRELWKESELDYRPEFRAYVESILSQ